MIRRSVAVAMSFGPMTAALAVAAPLQKDSLLVPPASAEHFVVVSEMGKHGDVWRWPLPDGRIAIRDSELLRGWVTEMDATIRYDRDGRPVEFTVRGAAPALGDASETYREVAGTATWASASDSGRAPAGKRVYLAGGGNALVNGRLFELLVTAGDKGVDLLPSGHASLKLGPGLTIDGPDRQRTVKLAFIRGIGAAPVPIWLDEHNKFFAEVGRLATLPAGFEAHAKALRDAQDAAVTAEVEGISRHFLTTEARRPVLFDNVQMFDADKGVFVKNRAVLASNGQIAQIGAAGSLKAPSDARMIDGRGRTLIPGLWDSHQHLGNDWAVLGNIATGMTSLRSPGSSIARAQEVIRRRAALDLLSPEPFASIIVDRKGPLGATGGFSVDSEAETIAAVRAIKDAGLTGVKFYTSMNPAWIAPAAAEAHRLGLHVHGHVPAGMRALDAVRSGYDEINHIYFVLMQVMPQYVVDRSNTDERSRGPARFTKDVDWTSPAMQAFIAELKQRGTVIDPTLVILEGSLTVDSGVVSPAYTAYTGIISPVLDRSFKRGGLPLADGYTREDYRRSFAKMIELVGRLHVAGIPIVAGTDSSGIELVRELELYQKAGFSPAEALQSATIVAARLVGADRRTGSIAVGKEADMVLVDGDPSRDLGALRRVLTVVSDGYVMDADDLRRAAGYSGQPR